MATQPDQVNAGALGTIVVVGACAMLGISLAITALVRTEVAAEAETIGKNADSEVRTRAAEQQAVLNAPPAWEDRSKGLVAIPVEAAMQVVLEELRQNPYAATPSANKGGAGSDAAAGGPQGTTEATTKTNEKKSSEDGAGAETTPAPKEPAQNGGAKTRAAPTAARKAGASVAARSKRRQSGSARKAPKTRRR